MGSLRYQSHKVLKCYKETFLDEDYAKAFIKKSVSLQEYVEKEYVQQ